MTVPRAAQLVILTGAGISAESGLRTFRAADGLWENHRVQDVATPGAFQRNPALVYRFYNERRRGLAGVRPNAAHLALAQLEREWEGDLLLVTQNVDDLHDRAGSNKLLHMHGELLMGRCLACEAVQDWPGDMDSSSRCPNCGRGPMRPHIVWFGEMPLDMDRIHRALGSCDLFVAIGTSGHVYPAAGFVEAVRPGVRTVELNLEPSLVTSAFQEARVGRATDLVPAFVAELLGG
jgi:NAD-dependent deacetylase